MDSGIGRQPDPAARRAGLLLVLTAAATVVAVVGRVAADADHPTLAESLIAISDSSGLYAIGGAARFIAGVTLIAGAWFLLRTWIIRQRLGTPKAGFALGGLALIVAPRYQWKVGATLRRVAPVTAIIGIALQLIWIDAIIMLHTVSGAAFLVWLVVIGTMMFTGRVERHFVAFLASASPQH